MDPLKNRIYIKEFLGSQQYKGIAIGGNNSEAVGLNSLALGFNIKTPVSYSYGFGKNFTNNEGNTIGIGINAQTIKILAPTTNFPNGQVGIGTFAPSEIFEVYSSATTANVFGKFGNAVANTRIGADAKASVID